MEGRAGLTPLPVFRRVYAQWANGELENGHTVVTYGESWLHPTLNPKP